MTMYSSDDFENSLDSCIHNVWFGLLLLAEKVIVDYVQYKWGCAVWAVRIISTNPAHNQFQ